MTFVILHILFLYNNTISGTSDHDISNQKTLYKEIYSRNCIDMLIAGGKQVLIMCTKSKQECLECVPVDR